MAPFDECSVLLPSATLEDFPTGGSDADARSLLAGWTVLWHPLLLARAEQTPTWYRADAPPPPDGRRILVVPTASMDQVTSDFRRRCESNSDCIWVTGADRSEMLDRIGLQPESSENLDPIQHLDRIIAIEDFYAAGYLSLQIQIMTRRLRYTSNLDELHLQDRITSAAKAFLASDAEAAAEGLHDVFDALSEERDHYFSSDPHLIDLTLLTPSVLETAIDSGALERLAKSATSDNEDAGIQGTPRNLLLDGRVAAYVAKANNDPNLAAKFEPLRTLLQSDAIGFAGGGAVTPSMSPDGEPTSVCFDALTMSQASVIFQSGTALAKAAFGKTPVVFGQYAGSTPLDLIPSLSCLGYQGVIPIDFAEGTGFGEESKVIVSGGGYEIEALTSKPIDAGSDAAFLSIGPLLGEAIDTGEVATAMLVHWPDHACDSFRDLTRAATWCVALGRFWTLENYFREGERPYHSGSIDSVSGSSAASITQTLIDKTSHQTLQSIADSFCSSVRSEAARVTSSIATMAKPELVDRITADASTAAPETVEETARQLISEALGIDNALAEKGASGQALCFNPHGVGLREQCVVSAGSPKKEEFVYGSSAGVSNTADVTFDLPAMGFTRLVGSEPIRRVSFFKRLTGRNKGIAESAILRNEFMAVSLDEATGGIAGVFSASRGNRLSVKLVAGKSIAGDSSGGNMVCKSIRTLSSDHSVGILEATGELSDTSGVPITEFKLVYELRRGSRNLSITGTLTPKCSWSCDTGSEVWNNAFSLRSAVASEASIVRGLIRDKVHSTPSRKIVAPLGVLIDESEKQTLITGHGLPLHRKVSDRFVDTLIAAPPSEQQSGKQLSPNENAIPFKFTISFDSPNPVSIARAQISPPIKFWLSTEQKETTQNSQAWLIHVAPSDVVVTDLSTMRRDDGKLAARLQLVQTRPKSARVKLQFCVPAQAAFIADFDGVNRSLEELPDNVTCDDGTVSLSMGHHQSLELVVVFDV